MYDPIAEWTWNPNGWAYKLGVLDFAGGAPVHFASGSAALAYSYALGKRTGFGTEKLNYRPHNITPIIIGTGKDFRDDGRLRDLEPLDRSWI